MKIRKVDYLVIFLCIIAAALCGTGSSLASLFFVASSSIGLIDNIKNKIITGALVNGIFLTLNLHLTIQNFIL